MRWVIVIAVIAAAAYGCVPVPTPVRPDIEQMTTLVPNTDIRVTIGPRRFLEALSDRIEEKYDHIEVVDPLTFRDAAFPDGGWYLRDLLAADSLVAVTEDLRVRYLAIVRDRGNVSEEWDEFRAPMIMGAAAYTERFAFAALIIDLESRSPLAYLLIDAQGRGAGGYFLLYGLFTIPQTEEGAESGVVDAIANAVPRGDGDKVGIAVLAGESEIQPFCLVTDVPQCSDINSLK